MNFFIINDTDDHGNKLTIHREMVSRIDDYERSRPCGTLYSYDLDFYDRFTTSIEIEPDIWYKIKSVKTKVSISSRTYRNVVLTIHKDILNSFNDGTKCPEKIYMELERCQEKRN